MQKYIFHFRIIFNFFVKLNISIKFIKILIVYLNLILFNQKINALSFSTTEKNFKTIFAIRFLETIIDLKHCLKFTKYIKNHIYFYSIIVDFLQKAKTQLLK